MSDELSESMRNIERQREARVAAIEAEVRVACRRIGIPYDRDEAAALALGAEHAQRTCAVVRELVCAIFGVNSRITQLSQQLVRAQATVNSVWNTTNVMWHALQRRLIAQGIFKDEDDLTEAVKASGEVLMQQAMEEAKDGKASADVIQDHVNALIQEHAHEFVASVGEAAAARVAKDREHD